MIAVAMGAIMRERIEVVNQPAHDSSALLGSRALADCGLQIADFGFKKRPTFLPESAVRILQSAIG
jgi:hypothetical protein